MGYFSNSSEWDWYWKQNCDRCRHETSDPDDDTKGCPIQALHFLHNEDACDDKHHFLHTFIPLVKGVNQQCTMFIEAPYPHPRLPFDE
jgi:hypothetical protein